MPKLETEKVTENYQPAPGQMATRTFWIAYPDHVSNYAHMEDRISRATGVGKTRKAALEAAALACGKVSTSTNFPQGRAGSRRPDDLSHTRGARIRRAVSSP